MFNLFFQSTSINELRQLFVTKICFEMVKPLVGGKLSQGVNLIHDTGSGGVVYKLKIYTAHTLIKN